MDVGKLKALVKRQVQVEAICFKEKVQYPELEQNWDKMYHMMKSDMEECIEFMQGCTMEELEAISPIFDVLAAHFQSQDFVKEIKRLGEQWPNPHILRNIKYAEEILKN